jgi:hypothetical protein
MARPHEIIPVKYCSDPLVQAFVEAETWAMGPYSQPEFTRSAREVFQAARDRFGDYACWDLRIELH